MTVYSSAQGPANLRALLGKVLKCPAHKLNVVTKRVGGAFGCKITR
jgi:CO/xanthine dehydrogenase Mo-binding subunit